MPEYAGFTEQVTPAKVALFYLEHPGRLPHLGFAGLSGAAQYRPGPGYLANYPPDSGQLPNTAEHRLESVTGLFSLYAVAPGLLALHWLAAILIFAIAAYRRSPVGWTGLLLMTALVCQFWAVLLSEGMADLIKHMAVVDLITALTVPLGLALWVARRRPAPGVCFESALGSPIVGEGGRRTMPQASSADHLRQPTTHTGPQPPRHPDPRPSPKAIGGPARAMKHN
jgi:hypothetical protein